MCEQIWNFLDVKIKFTSRTVALFWRLVTKNEETKSYTAHISYIFDNPTFSYYITNVSDISTTTDVPYTDEWLNNGRPSTWPCLKYLIKLRNMIT